MKALPLILSLLAFVLAGCTVGQTDPRYQAQADKQAAEVVAYATKAAEAARVQMLKNNLGLQEREQLSPYLMRASATIVTWSSVSMSVAVCVFLLALALSGSMAVMRVGRALGQRGELAILGLPAPQEDDREKLPILVHKFLDGSALVLDPRTRKTIAIDKGQVWTEENYQNSTRVRITGAILVAASTSDRQKVRGEK